MSNELKLLTALCEALGFEVKTLLDYQERKESLESAKSYFSSVPRVRQLSAVNGQFVIDDDGNYTSLLTDPVVSFKVRPVDKDPQS